MAVADMMPGLCMATTISGRPPTDELMAAG
jgi:hypothetical protein